MINMYNNSEKRKYNLKKNNNDDNEITVQTQY